jgi:hypothetical protein
VNFVNICVTSQQIYQLFIQLIKYGSSIEKDEMGRTCGAYGGGKRGAQGVGGEA